MHHGERDGTIKKDDPLLEGIHDNGKLRSYGRHQKYIKVGEEGPLEVLAESTSDKTNETFVEAYKKGNVYGVQFHPEKIDDHKKIFYNLMKDTPLENKMAEPKHDTKIHQFKPKEEYKPQAEESDAKAA